MVAGRTDLADRADKGRETRALAPSGWRLGALLFLIKGRLAAMARQRRAGALPRR
jgi:hypothetical protein